MPLIFLSYRRLDSQPVTRQIYDVLVQEYGKKSITFLDEEDIRAGDDIRQTIRDSLNQCPVVMPVIGATWLESIIDSGISAGNWDEPRDWVWLELQEALSHDEVAVLPLLIDDVKMPQFYELPPKLRKLSFQQGFKVCSKAVREDVRWLIRKRLNELIYGSALSLSEHLSTQDDYEPFRREHYRHELQYCLENTNGEIDEISSIYLDALKQYLLISHGTAQRMNDSGAQAYRLYGKIVVQMIESCVSDDQAKPSSTLTQLEDLVGRASINYLRRLHANLRIPKWNAMKIERRVFSKWKEDNESKTGCLI